MLPKEDVASVDSTTASIAKLARFLHTSTSRDGLLINSWFKNNPAEILRHEDAVELTGNIAIKKLRRVYFSFNPDA